MNTSIRYKKGDTVKGNIGSLLFDKTIHTGTVLREFKNPAFKMYDNSNEFLYEVELENGTKIGFEPQNFPTSDTDGTFDAHIEL